MANKVKVKIKRTAYHFLAEKYMEEGYELVQLKWGIYLLQKVTQS